MALKKQIDFKGMTAEYWTIIERDWIKTDNITRTVLALYFNQQTRLDNIENYLDKKAFVFTGELSTADLYTQIKIPILDEDGDDINIFADAEDC